MLAYGYMIKKMWMLLLSGNISEAVHTPKNFSVYILMTKQTVKKGKQTPGVAFLCIAEPGRSWSFCFKLLLSVFSFYLFIF